MDLLDVVRRQGLRDWAVGAGFVRAAVWDALSGVREPTPLADIDVIYFDPANAGPGRDRAVERALARARPGVPWSVKNQARMHRHNRDRPYACTADALARWLETPTCVAVRLEADGRLTLLAPLGLADLFAMRVRPTPAARRNMQVFRNRAAAKAWHRAWPRLRRHPAPVN